VLGGRTSLDNLVLLCGEHHRLLHRGGFGIVALGRQRFRFRGTGTGATAATPVAPPTYGDAAALTSNRPDITPATIEPDWDGTGLHLHDTVNGLLTSWGGGTSSDAAGSDASGGLTGGPRAA
jgi:hypothetical protein